ncbi:tyrosine-protein phosphatase [Seongchinamella sediminis]|uniref:Tyrosine-protein phosphatase n=1 Tax=Seongchinamella sediminis TaxID=2283635 RepID=A0A3L7DV90_9GAMM|nr:tyrosine-protein phosphatase [Seongchinamella sediminis]RLQ21036.1 tyrosine-protein phosphatase [Seongchinamella sediminis]
MNSEKGDSGDLSILPPIKRGCAIIAVPLSLWLTAPAADSAPEGYAVDTAEVTLPSSIGIAGRNFRDLGGYKTIDGHTLRQGVLYRSGNLSGLLPAEQTALAALGIRSICDFRTLAEREERPDPQLPGSHQVEGCQDDSLKTSLSSSFQKLLDMQSSGQEVDWRGIMIRNYSSMGGRYADSYRAMFAALLSDNAVPMLFHCTAGKDRTGVAAALVLSVLGVPRQTILEDYEASALDPVEWVGIDSKVYPKELVNQPALAIPDPTYIQAALEGIEEQYGSLDYYFHSVLGLNEADISILRNKLLTRR